METVSTPCTADLRYVSDVAEELGINASTLRRWVNCGYVRGYRVGRRRLMVSRADVAAAIRPVAVLGGGRA